MHETDSSRFSNMHLFLIPCNRDYFSSILIKISYVKKRTSQQHAKGNQHAITNGLYKREMIGFWHLVSGKLCLPFSIRGGARWSQYIPRHLSILWFFGLRKPEMFFSVSWWSGSSPCCQRFPFAFHIKVQITRLFMSQCFTSKQQHGLLGIYWIWMYTLKFIMIMMREPVYNLLWYLTDSIVQSDCCYWAASRFLLCNIHAQWVESGWISLNNTIKKIMPEPENITMDAVRQSKINLSSLCTQHVWPRRSTYELIQGPRSNLTINCIIFYT